MNKTIVIILIAILAVTGLATNQWSVAGAQGTVPTVIPPAPIIPVTGSGPAALCQTVMLDIKEVATVCFLDFPVPGSVAYLLEQTKEEDVKLLTPMTFLTEVFQITTPDVFTGEMRISVYLTPIEKETLVKDAEYGLYHYDVLTATWERVVAVVDGDYISATTNKTGIFVVGKK